MNLYFVGFRYFLGRVEAGRSFKLLKFARLPARLTEVPFRKLWYTLVEIRESYFSF
jgi:hypothetical protein